MAEILLAIAALCSAPQKPTIQYQCGHKMLACINKDEKTRMQCLEDALEEMIRKR